ncbi:hypothetical protein ACFL6U_19370 [Planctomycetota bacterium]
MNTFWLKIAGGVVVALVVLVVAARLFSPEEGSQESAPEPAVREDKTFADQVEEDRQKFAVEVPPEAPPAEPVSMPVEQTPPQPESTPAPRQDPITIYVKELDEIDAVRAEQLLSAAVPGRSMGRLRVGYNLTLQNCRRILDEYPDTWYAFQAKRLLADIPERFHEQYKITDATIDISGFLKPGRDKQPRILPPDFEM